VVLLWLRVEVAKWGGNPSNPSNFVGLVSVFCGIHPSFCISSFRSQGCRLLEEGGRGQEGPGKCAKWYLWRLQVFGVGNTFFIGYITSQLVCWGTFMCILFQDFDILHPMVCACLIAMWVAGLWNGTGP
jgi:hypothetical protein